MNADTVITIVSCLPLAVVLIALALYVGIRIGDARQRSKQAKRREAGIQRIERLCSER